MNRVTRTRSEEPISPKSVSPDPDDLRAGVTVERCAEALAHVRQFPGGFRAELLRRLDLDEARFGAAVEAWSSAIAEGLAREDPTWLLRFARALGTTDRRLRSERPPLSEVRASPAWSAPSPRDASPHAVGSAPEGANAALPAAPLPVPLSPVAERPSFMKAPAPPGSSAANPWTAPVHAATNEPQPAAVPAPPRPPPEPPAPRPPHAGRRPSKSAAALRSTDRATARHADR